MKSPSVPEVLPSELQGETRETLCLDLPQCCPKSKNPFPGSKLMIIYYPDGVVIEVASMTAYLHGYIGGYRDETGEVVIRDMEGMIKQVAKHCAQVARVPVTVCADLVIKPTQKMYLFLRMKPEI